MSHEQSSSLVEWSNLFDEFAAFGERVYAQHRDVIGRSDDPKMIGTIIFHRVWGHFRSFAVLWKERLSLDADVVLRNCCEAAICLANLQTRPEGFMADLRSDAASTLSGQIGVWRKVPGTEELVQRASTQMLELFGAKGVDGKKHTKLQLELLAADAGVSPLYHYYRTASGAGAHITGLSLLFHMAEGSDAGTEVLRERREKAREQSLAHMCVVMGVASLAFCLLVEAPEAEEARHLATKGHGIGVRFQAKDGLD